MRERLLFGYGFKDTEPWPVFAQQLGIPASAKGAFWMIVGNGMDADDALAQIDLIGQHVSSDSDSGSVASTVVSLAADASVSDLQDAVWQHTGIAQHRQQLNRPPGVEHPCGQWCAERPQV